jgi:AcrR family transcriptional regulator
MSRQKREERSSGQAILESARKLFTAKGYEATSVDAILADCNLSKGTFYHRFQSKSEVLDAVVETMLREGMTAAAPFLEDSGLDAAEKLDRFLVAGRTWRLSNARTVAEVAKVVLDDENALLREKLRRRSAEVVLPVLTRIISEGLADGTFSIPDPDPGEVAALILHLAEGAADANYRELLSAGGEPGCLERVKKRADACFTAIERMLGAQSGILSRLEDDFLSAVSRALGSGT